MSGSGAHIWNATDGNPGGCLEVQDSAAGPWSVASAPAAYLGSWAGLSAADTLSYDAIHIPSGTQPGSPPYIFRIEGPGGVATFSAPGFPPHVWNRFAAPIDPAAWNVTSGTWADVVANVTSLTVAAEMISGDETVRVDNIRLGGTPAPVALACAIERFEIGTLGWSATTASLARVTTDGDIGAYLRVAESGAAARVLAPAWYGGDWSAMDGTGAITFSFTILAGAVEPGRAVRVEATGPGGSAFATEPSESFLPVTRLWHVLSWPLDESAWTVTSGTWAGLLADVQELAVSADLSAGNNQYGLDNVVRGAACAVDPDVPLALHEPGYSVCGQWRFRDGSALALNPADGELYALVDATTAAGGGVYPITGAGAGARLQPFTTPIGLVFTADGDGFVSDNNSGVLYRFVDADSSMVWANTFQAGDDDIAGMIVAPPGFEGPNVTAGDLLVTDHGNGGPDGIWAVSPDSANGERLLVPDPGSADWYDLATDGATVWAADALDHDALWVIHPDGAASLLPLSQPVAGKRALVYDPGQDVLYTVKSTSPIGLHRIDPDDGEVTLVADGIAGVGDGNLEIDPVARMLWLADDDQSRIYGICLPPATTVSAGGPQPVAPVLDLALRPHPVTAMARISLELPRAARVRLDVIDAAGRQVGRLLDAPMPAGRGSVDWDVRDARGRRVAPGVYFLRLEADGAVRTAKAVVLR